MEEIFTKVYENSIWGNNHNSNYKGSSGDGSSIEYNATTYVPFLKKFITDHEIRNVVDLGCGDFRCGPLIYDDLDVHYTGYDSYKKIIDYHLSNYAENKKYNFVHLDFCNNPDVVCSGDLCILKDVIQHWSKANIIRFLDYLCSSGKFKYILITNCGNQQSDRDIKDGDWRRLSAKREPLNKYSPEILYNYGSKEVSVIRCG
jgi:SAM-dependent methyltransferase